MGTCTRYKSFYALVFVFYISFLLLTMIKQNTYEEYVNLTPQNSKNKKVLDTFKFIEEPFYFAKKGSHQTNELNSTLTLTTFCESNSINSLSQLPIYFTNGPISISIYFTSKKNVISLIELSQYFMGVNNLYDIYIGILYPNP
eukprot:463216_1